MELHAHLAQRKIGLGSQEQHEQSGEEVELAGEETEPDRDGDDRDRDAREELEGEARQERHPQHRHRLVCVVRRDPFDALGGASVAAVDLERSETSHGVGEARREPLQRAVLAALDGSRRKTDEHHEDRDEGEGQDDDEPRDRSESRIASTRIGIVIAVATNWGR